MQASVVQLQGEVTASVGRTWSAVSTSYPFLCVSVAIHVMPPCVVSLCVSVPVYPSLVSPLLSLPLSLCRCVSDSSFLVQSARRSRFLFIWFAHLTWTFWCSHDAVESALRTLVTSSEPRRTASGGVDPSTITPQQACHPRTLSVSFTSSSLCLSGCNPPTALSLSPSLEPTYCLRCLSGSASMPSYPSPVSLVSCTVVQVMALVENQLYEQAFRLVRHCRFQN